MSTVKELQAEVKRLEQWIDDCQKGMSINCVYCGHNYGPDDGRHLVTMRDALRVHVENCVKHPMYGLRMRLMHHETTVLALNVILKEIEQHCPCGARPESPNTHPHVIGCPVERGLLSLKLLSEAEATLNKRTAVG